MLSARKNLLHIILLALFVGVLAVELAVYWLWSYYKWMPDIQASSVQFLLIGIIQTQAGILAIAVSFSLLYVQISVEAYSLRAAQLLIYFSSFQRIVAYYVSALVINSLLALFITPNPAFLPWFAGMIGVTLFVYGLVVLVIYIADVAYYITPEAIVQALRKQIDPEHVRQEALKLSLQKSWKEKEKQGQEILISMPIGIAEQSRIGDELRVMIDVAKRMVRQSDHVAVKAVIDGIVCIQESYCIPEPVSLDRKIAVDQLRRAELANGALLAYLSGILMEIWSAAIQSIDMVTANMLVRAMDKLLKYGALDNSVACTNVLQVAVHDQMFQDTTRLGWLELRQRVICLITDKLSDIAHKDYRGKHPNAWKVFELLEGMGRTLLKEDRKDVSQIVFRGIAIFGEYGATTGEDAIIDNVGRFLRDLAQQGHVAPRSMADLVSKMGVCWVQGASLGEFRSKPFWYLLKEGVQQAVYLYNQTMAQSHDSYYVPANSSYLDALEEIAKTCVEAQRWDELKYTLEITNSLITDQEHTPSYAAFCLSNVLDVVAKIPQSPGVDVCIGAINEFLDRIVATKSKCDDITRLLSTLQRMLNSEILTDSKLKTKLVRLVERVKQVEFEKQNIS